MVEGFCLAVAAISLSAAAQIALKAGASKLFDASKLSPRAWIFIGYTGFIASAILSLIALRSVPLSLYVAWASSSYILIGMLSVWLLKEKLSSRQWMGLLLIVCGIVTFSFS